MTRIPFLDLYGRTFGWIAVRNCSSAVRAEVGERANSWQPPPAEPYIPLH